jgi:hypothetical protein
MGRKWSQGGSVGLVANYGPCPAGENRLNIKNSTRISLAPEKYQDRNHHWRDEILSMVPTQGKQDFALNLHWTEFFSSSFFPAVVTVVQMGVMSKLT